MSKSVDKLYDLFSREIFGKPFDGLPSMAESWFITRHTHWYRSYRLKIARAVREAMDVKKLRGEDYDLIQQWYFEQIPAATVISAIDEVSRYARNNGKVIYSINYFKKAITRSQTSRSYLSVGANDYTGVDDDDKWHFKSYTAWESGKLDKSYYKRFCPFKGPNPHEGVTR